MADKLTIELELDPELSKQSRRDLEKKAAEAGKKAGDEFEKEFKNKTKDIGKSLSGNFTKIVASLTAALAGFRAISQSVDFAVQQEAAVTRLNNQLKLTGDFSRGASLGLQSFASKLQSVSRFGDEVILNQLALAKAFGASNDQAKQIVSTSIDLAEAFGIDLESATRNVAKTLGGYAGELGETIPALKALTQEQLQAGEGIKLIAKRFDGAGKNIRDYNNLTSRLSNTFGDALEQIGFFITKNETFLSGLQGGISVLEDFGGGLSVIRKELLGIGQTQVTSEVGKINGEISKLRIELNDLIDATEGFRGGAFGTGLLVDSRTIAVNEERIKTLRDAISKLIAKRAEASKKAEENAATESGSSESKTQKQISDLQLLQQAGVQTENLLLAQRTMREEKIAQLRQRNLIGDQEQKQLLLESETLFNEQLTALENKRVENAIEANGTITQAVVQAAKTQQASLIDLGKQVLAISVNGFGKAFSNIGAALAKGESASQAFVDSVKATFGEIASAIGDYYIKLGVAELFINPARGTGLIAAGAGIKVLAGALGSSGGSTGDTQATAAGFSSSPSDLQSSGAFDQVEIEETEPNTNVQVVIQGNILDSDETGTEIARTLSDAFGKQGIVLAQPRFAR